MGLFGRESTGEPKVETETTQPPDSLFTPAYIQRDHDDARADHSARPRTFGSKARRTAKKFVGEPEDAPETIHTFSYLAGNTGNVKQRVKDYALSLFPFIQWAPRYNVHWLFGDLIA
jgi:hypothetical protein